MDTSIHVGRGVQQDPTRQGDWMQTFTGAKFYPAEPRPDEVHLLDIAYSLGNIARYNGHCRFYSVAEHSVYVSRIVPPEHALDALFHDAPEAYTGDVTRPIKRNLGPENLLFHFDKLIWGAIAAAFGLSQELHPEIKIADNRILLLEKRLLHPRSDPWHIPYEEPKDIVLKLLPPFEASTMFLRRYCDLTAIPFMPLYKHMLALHLELGE